MTEQQTAQETAATEQKEAASAREAGVWLIITKDGTLAERKTKKEALAAVQAVGLDNVAAVYKQAKLVELKTKVQVQF